MKPGAGVTRPTQAHEKQWIEASQKNPEAFNHIFDQYHDEIYNHVLRRTCNVALSQDITATTFMKALQSLSGYKYRGIPFSAWLYRIAINEINLNHRKARRMTTLSVEQSENLKSDQHPDDGIIFKEEEQEKFKRFRRIHHAVSQLKPKYQDVISLRYFEDKSIKEISEILNVPENTVKTHIRRGLHKLRDKL